MNTVVNDKLNAGRSTMIGRELQKLGRQAVNLGDLLSVMKFSEGLKKHILGAMIESESNSSRERCSESLPKSLILKRIRAACFKAPNVYGSQNWLKGHRRLVFCHLLKYL